MSVGKQFLSSVIKDGNRTFLNRLKPTLLENKSEGVSELAMYNFIQQHITQYRTLPTRAVLSASNIPYIDTDQPPEYYMQELKKRAVYLAYKDFTHKVGPLTTQAIDYDVWAGHITDLHDQISALTVADRYKNITELGREIEESIESRKNGAPEVFVPFGWPTLDNATGGLAGGDLAYFIARPGVGKTNILSYSAHHAWKQGFSPMLLTMEMTDVQISRRIYGLEGQFNPDAVRRGIPDAEVEKRLGNAINSFDEGVPFHIICGQVKQTVESITALVDELRPDVLYIDAAYLVSMNGPSKAAWEKLAAVSERLKQVAVTRNIPIIMTVQFNRDAAKGKRYELDTIAGSDAIGQLGSVIVSIREGDDQYEGTRRILNIIKNREGGVGEFEIHNRFDPPDFSEVANNSSIADQEEEEYVL